MYIYIYTYTSPLHPSYIPQPWRVLTSLQAGGVAAHVEVGGRGVTKGFPVGISCNVRPPFDS